ncbi:DUF2235 domain-containing protein [Rhodococcus spelaei]|uniref:DUF2235 domain-containing protein n=1 Tax=Rhodococcus spelaei TaxID=2546320 RepID=A0A541B2C7_9NOCA|nr:DUF2235 domain-containing protein [Rhodococcus spelaei]
MPDTQPTPPPPAPKRIVVCFDGTGNQIRATRNTNVIRLFRALENTAGEQILFYDPGVGTLSAAGAHTRIGRWYSRMLGLAFGLGLKTNLADAYTFLMNHWEPGDQIFIFGFSRGAYTARALAGLLHLIGIPRQASDNLVEYAIATYARRHKWTDADRAEAAEFSSTLCRAVDGSFSIPVHYLGVWDTVSAPGIFRRDLSFPNTHHLSNVLAGRHAISIDEKRRPYRQDPVRNPRIEEAWFAGVHSDVGGGFEEHELSDISLMWVLDGARTHGVQLRRTEELRELPTLEPADATARVHPTGWIWSLLIWRHRRPAPGVNVHASVRLRREHDPSYGSRLQDPNWVDEGWDRHPADRFRSAACHDSAVSAGPNPPLRSLPRERRREPTAPVPQPQSSAAGQGPRARTPRLP